MKNLKDKNTIAGFVTFLIGTYIFIESIRLLGIGEYYDSPGLLPAMISIVIIFSSAMLIWSGLRGKVKSSPLNDEDHTLHKKEPFINLRIIIVIIIITIYIIALNYFGFMISSISFLFILMVYLKSANMWKVTVISIVVPICIQYIFRNIFNQIIP